MAKHNPLRKLILLIAFLVLVGTFQAVHAFPLCTSLAGQTLQSYINAGACQYGGLVFEFPLGEDSTGPTAGISGTYTYTPGDNLSSTGYGNVTASDVNMTIAGILNPDGTGYYGFTFSPKTATSATNLGLPWFTTAADSVSINVDINYNVAVCTNADCTLSTPLGPNDSFAIVNGTQVVPFEYASDPGLSDGTYLAQTETLTALVGTGGASFSDSKAPQNGTCSNSTLSNPYTWPSGPSAPAYYNTNTNATVQNYCTAGNAQGTYVSTASSTSGEIAAQVINVSKDIGISTNGDSDMGQINAITETYQVVRVTLPEPSEILLTAAGIGLLALLRNRKRLLGMLGMLVLVVAIAGSAHANPVYPSCVSLTGDTLAGFVAAVNSTGCYLGDDQANGVVFTSASFTVTNLTGGLSATNPRGNNPANDSVNINWDPVSQSGMIDIVPPIQFSATSGTPAKSETVTFTMTGDTELASLTGITGGINANGSGATSILNPVGTTQPAPSSGSFSGNVQLADGSNTANLGVNGKTTTSGAADNTTYSLPTGVANFSSGNVGQNQIVTLTETYQLQTKVFSATNNDGVHLSSSSVTINEQLTVPEPLSDLLAGGGLLLIGCVFRRRIRRG